jgi:hypothetical protein
MASFAPYFGIQLFFGIGAIGCFAFLAALVAGLLGLLLGNGFLQLI